MPADSTMCVIIVVPIANHVDGPHKTLDHTNLIGGLTAAIQLRQSRFKLDSALVIALANISLINQSINQPNKQSEQIYMVL